MFLKETEITCIQEMMNLLENYSQSLLMDDYYAIKAMIDKENNYYSESETDQKTDNRWFYNQHPHLGYEKG